ncbi:MAG: hypothetical protein HYU66_21180 [Armatimonadetes bacterium]|nr:hypothetical protein [Armatimonadota bacterium]
MKRLEAWERLVAAARRGPAPAPDVTAAVRSRLAVRAAPAGHRWPLGFAGACASLALVVGVLGCQAWSALNEGWLAWLLGVSGGWVL